MLGELTGFAGSLYTLLASGPPQLPVGSVPWQGMLQAWLGPCCRAVASLRPADTTRLGEGKGRLCFDAYVQDVCSTSEF